MKLRYQMSCLLFALLAGCAVWHENVELHGVKFQRATVDSKGLVIGYMEADAVVGGRPCRKGWIHLHPNGTPAGFTASQDIALPRYTIPAGTWVIQNPDGIVTVCAFPRDVEIQGHVCRGSADGPTGVQTAFYPNGALKQFFAPGPVTIDGVPCRSSLFEPGIELYENGKLRRAVVARDFTLEGQVHHQGEPIQLASDGRAGRD
jgi:hypothetical protein